MAEILVIDDDRSIRRSLELQLLSSGHIAHIAATVAEGRDIWINEKPDLVILDLMLPDGDGLELLTEAVEGYFGGLVIMITGHHDLDKAVSAMHIGAFDYIHKPINVDELEMAINRALTIRDEREKLALIADLAVERKPGKIVGESRAALELHKQIGMASRGRANVLIRGESGTGKELVAHAIHRNSTPGAPFIPVNCSAIVPTLLESELFGHERGAFTGAVNSKPGRFELAEDGSLFLDEIGDMETGLQAKLLRVIQEKEFQRVGGTTDLRFSARIIAATNQSLELMIGEGKFREDLYYRLKVIDIHIPPLRERKDDLPQLIDHLLAGINKELRRNVTRVPTELMRTFVEYDWPGNVRELENLLMAGVIRSSGDTLQALAPKEFEKAHPLIRPEKQGAKNEVSASSSPIPNLKWQRKLSEVEREHISHVLDAVNGHLGRACEVLGITRPTLRKKMVEYNL